jgi:hypothetical protein
MAEDGLHLGLRDALQMLHNAHIKAEDAAAPPIAQTLLGVHEGLQRAVKVSRWSEWEVHRSVVLLSRMPGEDPLARLALLAMLSVGSWYEMACHCAQSVASSLASRSPVTREQVARGWLELSLLMLSEPALDRFKLPYDLLQAELETIRGQLGHPMGQKLTKRSGEFADAIEAFKRGGARGTSARSSAAARNGSGSNSGGGGGSANNPPARAGSGGGSAAPFLFSGAAGAAGGVALKTAPILPRADELIYGSDPPANKTRGDYASAEEYVGTHFALLREDFVSGENNKAGNKARWKVVHTKKAKIKHFLSQRFKCCRSVSGSSRESVSQSHILLASFSSPIFLPHLRSAPSGTPSTLSAAARPPPAKSVSTATSAWRGRMWASRGGCCTI